MLFLKLFEKVPSQCFDPSSSRWQVYRERKLQELDAFGKIIQKYHKLCLKAYMFERKLRFRVFGIDKTYISKGPTFIQPRSPLQQS